MKFRIISIDILIIIIACFLINRYNLQERYTFLPKKKFDNRILKVGIIGDSWVAGKKLDSGLVNEFSRHNVKVEVISCGEPGAKTKEIYYNLFKDTLQEFSSNNILKHNLDYCIVIGGVNDAVNEMGPKYYSHHLSLILEDLLKQKIKPVLLALPGFGIHQYYDSTNVFRRIQFKLSSYVTNNGNIGDINSYRDELNNTLRRSKLEDSIILVNADGVCTDYKMHKDLYKNSAHLSPLGNQFLSHYLANIILKKIGRG